MALVPKWCPPSAVYRKKTSTRTFTQQPPRECFLNWFPPDLQSKKITISWRRKSIEKLFLLSVSNLLCVTKSNNNGEAEIETPKSSEDDENNSEESSSNDTNLVDSSNNQLIKWTAEDLVTIDDSEEKIYEDLCYVTISSTFPSEVFIKKKICYLICCPPHLPTLKSRPITPPRKKVFYFMCLFSLLPNALCYIEIEVSRLLVLILKLFHLVSLSFHRNQLSFASLSGLSKLFSFVQDSVLVERVAKCLI